MPLLLPGLLIAIFPIIGALVLLGLSQSHSAVHGGQGDTSFWDYITGRTTFHQLADLVNQASRWLVSKFASAQLKMLAHWFQSLGTLVLGISAVNVLYAETVEAALQRLFTHGDPKARRAAQRAEATAAHGAKAARRADAHAGRVGHDLARYKAQTTPKVRHATHAVDVTIPHDLAGLRARNKALEDRQTKDEGAIRSLEDGAIRTFEWIKAHPLSAATGVFTGAVAVALARLGFGFLRCNSWKNLGKRITCGMGAWLGALLDLIATFALAYLGLLKPVVLAEAAVEAVDGIEGILSQILDN